MTVAVIASYAESLTSFRGHLLAAMIRAGHTVTACAPDFDDAVIKRLQSLGVRYHSLPLQRAGLNPLSDLCFFYHVMRFLQRERPEVLFCYTIKPVIYGSLAGRIARIPNVFSMISGLGYAFIGRGFRQKILSMVARTLYRLALVHNRFVFFQNPDDRALFEQLHLVRDHRQTVVVNGSGVDLVHFGISPLPPGPPVFLLVARLLRDKGVVEYVEAARLLKKKYPHINFRLVGPFDVNPASLKSKDVQAWQKEGIIEFQGRVPDVRPVIAAASVFVLPSYREGTPRTVLEAMAMGRPIITTDTAGCRETVVDGKNGFLVPVRDANALAQAMERFILNPDCIPKMGQRSREMVVEKFNVHKVNEVILSVMGLNMLLVLAMTGL